VKSGVRAEFFPNYYVNVVFTYLWVIGITNAFNLLDNLNGLSAGIACISALFLGVTFWMDGRIVVACLSVALAGSCLGFLKHNFPRASIFMGDSGSLVIGFLCASFVLLGNWDVTGFSRSVAVAFIILGYPIFDTSLVIAMRVIERRSVFQGGKDHSSHRLALLGLRKRRTVLAIYGICVALGLSALLAKLSPRPLALWVMVLTGLAMLGLGVRLGMVNTGRFGRKKGRMNA
jgi:UDP-GlcNAc:undecaprenyl-phosphate GlcNAc-1-phosphate transferase